MTTKISEELEQAVSRADDGTLKVEGVNGTYWVMTDDALRIRSEVLKGLDEGGRKKGISPISRTDDCHPRLLDLLPSLRPPD